MATKPTPRPPGSWGAHALGLLGVAAFFVGIDGCALGALFGFLSGVYAATWSLGRPDIKEGD